MSSAAAMPQLRPSDKRYKIRFPTAAAFEAATAHECTDFQSAVVNPKRLYCTLGLPAWEAGESAAEKNLEERLEFFVAQYGAEITEDPQYELDLPPGWPPPSQPGPAASLDEVIEAIGVRETWRAGNRGAGVTLAIVDTGVDGERAEIPPWKRRGSWQVHGARPYADPVGHGTMCAVVAAGNRDAGGRFEGVAPEAGILACRTRFFDSELAAIYDHLIGLVEKDRELRLITTNSFGRRSGTPPPPPTGDFPAALGEAISKGIAVFFSAGNNHELAGGEADTCYPESIWQYKVRADVCTVGACDLEGRIWSYSSRGPGQGHEAAGYTRKPDLVAPTPRYGLVAFGLEDRSFAEGWGTSGACPQAAGLAALLWTAEPGLSPSELFERLRQGARDLGWSWNCQGAGRLDGRSLWPLG